MDMEEEVVSVNIDELLNNAENLIKEGNYDDAKEVITSALEANPKAARAYALRLIIEFKVTSLDELKNITTPLDLRINYKKALEYGDDKLKAQLEAINEEIKKHAGEAKLQKQYDAAMAYKNAGRFQQAEQAFSKIADFKDAAKQASECIKAISKDLYEKALVLKENKKYDQAIEQFEKLADFSDSEKQAKECRELKSAEVYEQAMSFKDAAKYDKAITSFEQIVDYKDSKEQIEACQRLKEEAEKEAIYVACLIEGEINPYVHAGKLRQACEKLPSISGYKDADQLLAKYQSILADYEEELQKKREEQAKLKAKRKKRAKRFGIFAAIGAGLVTAALLLAFLYLVPENNQKNIQSLIDKGDYEAAEQAIEGNNGYGDSTNLQEMVKAGKAFDSGDYETGINYIYEMGGSVDVKFEADGADEKDVPGERVIKKEKHITETIKDESRPGYGFKQWELEKQNGKYVYTMDAAKHTASIKLVAQYKTITYNLTLEYGNGNADRKTTYTIESPAITIPDPTRTGYTFTGWTDNIDSSKKQKNVTIPTGSIGNRTYTATWEANKYKITYNVAGGNSVSPSTQQVTYDTSATLPTPTRTGYTFAGWYNESTRVNSGNWTIANDVTLTAHWTANTNTKYKVEHKLQSLDNESEYVLVDTDNKTGTSDSNLTISTINSYAKTYTGFTPVSYAKSETIKPDGTLVIEIKYTRNSYALNFVTNGGSNVNASNTMILKYDAPIPSAAVTSRTGSTFGGWYTDINQTTKFNKMPASNTTVYAYYSNETPVNNFDYTVSSNKVTITKGKQLPAEVVVPQYIDNKQVTAIGANAFQDCGDVTSVALPASVTSIGVNSFKNCIKLTTLTGTEAVTSIASGTFENCKVLTQSPDLTNVTSIGDNAFKDCVSLTTIILGDDLTSIGADAFSGCSSLLQIQDLSNVTSVGANAFKGCRMLSEIKGLNGCATLGEGILTACENIAKMTLVFQENVEQLYIAKFFLGLDQLDEENYYEISLSGWAGTTYYHIPKALKTIEYSGSGVIPAYLLYKLSFVTAFNLVGETEMTSVGNYSFSGCTSLSTFPDLGNVTSIGNYSFSGCASLSTAPNISKVTSIGTRAFEGVTVFTNVQLPNTVTTIGEAAFAGCSNIESMTVPFLGRDLSTPNVFGYFFGKNEYDGSYSVYQSNYYYIPSSLKSLTVLGGQVSSTACNNLSSLTDLTLGNSVTSIASGAFYGCSSLANLSVDQLPLQSSGYGTTGYSYTGSWNYSSYTEYRYFTYSGSATGNFDETITFTSSGEVKLQYYVSSTSYVALYILLNGVQIYSSSSTSSQTQTFNVKDGDVLTLRKYHSNSSYTRTAYVYLYFKTIETIPMGQLFGASSYTGSYYANGYYIPSSLKTITINSMEKISSNVFNGFSSVTRINLPETATSIGSNAFYGCSALASINDDSVLNIPKSVKKIGNYAFYGCAALTSIHIEEESELTAIGDGAFQNCTALTEFVFDGDASLESIGTSAFEGDSNLTKWGEDVAGTITIPDGTISIGDSVFKNLASISKIVMADSVETIGDSTFLGLTNLTDISSFKNINSIGNYAFYGCSSLPSIDIPAECTIGEQAFAKCANLTSASVPFDSSHDFYYYFGDSSSFDGGVSRTAYNSYSYYIPSGLVNFTLKASQGTICTGALYNLNQLTSLTIDDSVTSINTYAFSSCSGLTKLVIGSSVTSIGQYALSGCYSLKELTLPFLGNTASSNGAFGYVFGTSSYTNSYSANGYYIPTALKKLTVLGGSIASNSCANVTSLADLTIGESVTSIASGAFRGCNSLVNIEASSFPVPSYGTTGYTYSGSWSCTTYDQYRYFSYSSSSTGYVNETITFQRSGEVKLEYRVSTTSYITLYIQLNGSQIASTTSTSTQTLNITVKEGDVLTLRRYLSSSYSRTAYAYLYFKQNGTSIGQIFGTSSYTNSYLADVYYVPSSLKKINITDSNGIPAFAFKDLTSLTEVTIADTVPSIGDHAFYGCSNLTSINGTNVFNIPSSVTSIGNYAFADCVMASKVVVSGGAIGAYAFSGCSLLSNLELNEGVTSIGAYAFNNDISLLAVDVPATVTLIDENAFRGMATLTTVNVADNSNLKTIGDYAFYGCSSLTEFIFDGASSLESIGNYAFAGDSLIAKWGNDVNKKITIPNSIIEVGQEAFSGLNLIEDVVVGNSAESISARAFYGCSKLTNLSIPTLTGYTLSNYSYSGSFSYSDKVTYREFTYTGTSSGTYTETITMSAAGFVKVVMGVSYASYITSSVLKNSSTVASVTGTLDPLTVSISVASGDTITLQRYMSTSYSPGPTSTFQFYFCTNVSLGSLFGTSAYDDSYSANGYYIPTALKSVAITRQTSIPGQAFYGCTSLTRVDIPENTYSIGSSAFYGCTALRSLNGENTINIPETVETINTSAFRNCSSIDSLVLKEGLVTISSSTFRGNTSILTLDIPSTVTTIGTDAFEGDTSLTKVNVADESALAFINAQAFQNCTSLAEFIFDGSSSLSTIGDNAFSGDSLITKWGDDIANTITVPETVTEIGTQAFAGLSLITDVVVKGQNTLTNEEVFKGCSSLINLSLPSIGSATSEYTTSGYSCSGSFTTTLYSAYRYFYYSGSTTGNRDETITFMSAGEVRLEYWLSSSSYATIYVLLNGVQIISSTSTSTQTKTIAVESGDVLTLRKYHSNSSYSRTAYFNLYFSKTYVLGTLFGTDSYSNSYSADGFYIPSSLKTVSLTAQNNVPNGTFMDCVSLTRVNIPETTANIGDSAFFGCTSLKGINDENSVNLPETMSVVGEYAFYNCVAITSATIGHGSIRQYAFRNCTSLVDLTLEEGVTAIGDYGFADCVLLAKINSNEAGKAVFPDSLTQIATYAFQNCDLFTDVTFGPNVSALITQSFKGCSNIAKITLSLDGTGWSSVSFPNAFPDSISGIKEIVIDAGETIPNSLFYGMTYVEKITIPSSIKAIGGSAFSSCTSLEKINSDVAGQAILPDGVETIGTNAFYGCDGLTSIDLGKSLKVITEYMLCNCSNLTTITVPDTVTTIQTYAFSHCSNVTRFNSDVAGTLNVPASCEQLDSYCFYNMDGITTVNIGDKATNIGLGIFEASDNIENITLPFVGKTIKTADSSYEGKFGYIFGYVTTGTGTESLSGAIYSGITVSSSKYWYHVPTALRNVTVTVQTVIPSKAFYNCSMLETIVLPSGVTSEGADAYYNCPAIVNKTYDSKISSPWDGTTVATSFHSGAGTEENPYVIFDGNELAYLKNQVNSGTSYENDYFILTCDIDLNSKAFSTIGSDTNPFLGNINGRGHAIKNIAISGATTYVGLFGYFGGSLNHIGFDGGTITSSVSGSGHFYAGLIAYMTEDGAISDIYSSVNVAISGAYYLHSGGLVGSMEGGSITNSLSAANVSATNASLFAFAGGIVGDMTAGTISGCYSSGNITSNSTTLSYSKNGQIVGEKTDDCTITGCYKSSSATLTRYNTTPSVYNTEGTAGTAYTCATENEWSAAKWNIVQNQIPTLKTI